VRRRQLLERAAALRLAGALAACAGTGSSSSSSTPGTAPSAGGQPTLADLATQLRGPLLGPGTTHYANASVISNERYAGVHPSAIARAVVENDVAACVRFAARSSLPFAVRCKDCEEARENAEQRQRHQAQRRGATSLFFDM